MKKINLIGISGAILLVPAFTYGATMGNGFMDNGNSVMGNDFMNSSYMSDLIDDNAGLEDDDNNISNEDEYTVTEPTIHEGNLKITNVDLVEISDTLYVIGDLTISNADDIIITGKLRVTGKLIVNNSDVTLKNTGRLYFGSKKISNGSIKGKGLKVTTDLVAIDKLLKHDLTEEEWDEVVAIAKDARAELAKLTKDLASARKKKADTTSITEAIIENRTNFYADVSGYIGDIDQDRFEALEKAELAKIKRSLRIK